MGPDAALPETPSHSIAQIVVSTVRCRITAAAVKHGATARAIPMQLMVAVPLAILWGLLAAAVPVYAQLPYWVGLVIISTVFLSRIVSQTSERQQVSEQQSPVLAETTSVPATAQPTTALSHEESILLLLATPGPFLPKTVTLPAAVVRANASVTSVVTASFSSRRNIAEDKAVIAAYVSGFESGCSNGFCAGLATGLRCGSRKRQSVGRKSTSGLAAVKSARSQRNPLTNLLAGGNPPPQPNFSSLSSQRDSVICEIPEAPSELHARQQSKYQPQQNGSQPMQASWMGGAVKNKHANRHGATWTPLLTVDTAEVDGKSELAPAHISALLLANASDRASRGGSRSNRMLNLPGADSHDTTASTLLDPGRFCVPGPATCTPPESLRAPDSGSHHIRLTNRGNRCGSPRASSPASSVPMSRDGHSLSVRSESARQPTGSSLVSSNSTELLSAHSLQALCIEDDEQAQSVLQGLLEREGWKVHHVRLGEEGLWFLSLAADLPDIVIISHALQGNMDGLKVCSRIRERFSACQLTIVIVVQDTDGAWVAAQAIENGADGVLVKPYPGPQVVHKLHTLMADIAETRQQQEAQDLHPSWGTQVPSSRGRSSVPEEEDLLRLLPKSFQTRPTPHPNSGGDRPGVRQSDPTPQQAGAGLLFATSVQPQSLQREEGKDGSCGGQRRSDARQQREQELEVEREWEEDIESYTTTSHRTNSTRGTLTPPHSSLEISSGSASQPVSKVFFTSGWAGKPMIVDDNEERAAAVRGHDYSSSGDRKTKQLRLPPTASAAHNSALPPSSRVLPPRLGSRTSAPLPAVARLVHHQQVAVEEEEASNTLSFDCFAPPFRRCTSDSPSHASAANISQHLQSDSPSPPSHSPQAGNPSDLVRAAQSTTSSSLVFETNLGSQSGCSHRGSGSVFQFDPIHLGAVSAPMHNANIASDYDVSQEMSIRAEQLIPASHNTDATHAAPGGSGPRAANDPWVAPHMGSGEGVDSRDADLRDADLPEAHQVPMLVQNQHDPHGSNLLQQLQQQLHQLQQQQPHVPPASLTSMGFTAPTPLQQSAAMLWTVAATAPEAHYAPQPVPCHFVEYHQQRRQYQQGVPSPYQSQAVVMTSSLYTPSGFKAHPTVTNPQPSARQPASAIAAAGLQPLLNSSLEVRPHASEYASGDQRLSQQQAWSSQVASQSPDLDRDRSTDFASLVSVSSLSDMPTLQQHLWHVEQQRRTHSQEQISGQLQPPSSSGEQHTLAHSHVQHHNAQRSPHIPHSSLPQSPVFSMVAGGAPVVPRQPQVQQAQNMDRHNSLTASNAGGGASNSLHGYPSMAEGATYQTGRSSSGIVGPVSGSGGGLSVQEMDAMRFSALMEGRATQGSHSSAAGSRVGPSGTSRYEDATSLLFKALQSSSNGGSKERRRQAGSAWSEMPVDGT